MTDIHYLSVVDLSEKLSARELSCVEVTRHMLTRIETFDGTLRSYATSMADVVVAPEEQADRDFA